MTQLPSPASLGVKSRVMERRVKEPLFTEFLGRFRYLLCYDFTAHLRGYGIV